MNILSFSCTNGIVSHLTPLFVLNQRYFRRMPDINSFFLLPKNLHKAYQDAGITVLPIDFEQVDGSRMQHLMREDNEKIREASYSHYVDLVKSAFEMSKADIIIEDNEVLSTLIAEKNEIPRISLFRTGFFRSIDKNLRNSTHMHSMEKTKLGKGFDASMILKPKKKLSQLYRKLLKNTYYGEDVDYFMNYLNPKTKLIPGIPSIEKLPDDIENRDSFFYTGPLLVEDNPSEKLSKELNRFFDCNKERKTVFITTGLVDQDDIQEMVDRLLKEGYAVVSTREIIALNVNEEQFFHNSILPLNFICSKVDLIIHHCGSGMYHYPLLHQKPVITIGTRCYDREDIAMRLSQLKLSRHVPSKIDDENYMEIFMEHLRAFEKDELVDYEQLKKAKEEIHNTLLNFDMDEVIEYTLKTKITS